MQLCTQIRDAKAAGEQYGLSLVAVKSAEVDYLDPAFTDDLRQYLEDYTRYDVTMAYSNARQNVWTTRSP